MKSERRHELQHNELAEWLFKTGEQIKPHQNLILAIVAVIAVVVVGLTWWSRHSAGRINQAWTELGRAMDAGSPDQLGNIAEEYPNTIAGQTAAVLVGDIRLASACNQRFASATMAQRDLKAAQDSYSKILELSTSETLRERATYGMARVRETDGRLDTAKQLYSEVVSQWPDGAYAAAAKRRLADFKESETKKMFASLRKYEPKGEFAEEPGAFNATPPTTPPKFDVPKEPPVGDGPIDLGPPDVSKRLEGRATIPPGETFGTSPGGAAEKPAAPADKTKADANKKPADKKPADKKSSDTKSDAKSKKP
jgi:predicted negative regulator of RcsB-dependent stress response